MMTTFDTLRAVKVLVHAGVNRDQAEAMAELMSQTSAMPDISELATKADLEMLRKDIDVKLAANTLKIVLAMTGIIAILNGILYFLLTRH